jgi:opacity protein-like surface antigen
MTKLQLTNKVRNNTTSSLAAFATVAAVSSVLAGETYREDIKHVHTPAQRCFADREWQVDLFGAYAFSSSSQDGLFGDHAWGGGLGLNYYFSRNLGGGLEASVFDTPNGGDVLGQAALNIFVRFPIDHLCLAPYLFVGGGAVFNAEDIDAADLKGDSDDALWEGHAGIGVEYRINPHFGVFVDGRYTVVDKDDNDFATVRTGLRFAF